MEENKKKNIAFKCNYCDGGKDENGIGFCGPCSNRCIMGNIKNDPSAWCSNPQSNCYQYYDGTIDRAELERRYEEDHKCCSESFMLKNFAANAGQFRSVDKNGDMKSIRQTGVYKVSFLTTVFPYEPEENRVIFAAFINDSYDAGTDDYPGFVKSLKEDTRLSFLENDAQKLKFWDYYRNPNAPTSKKWGSGLFRYLEDDVTLRILNDAKKIVTDDEARTKIQNIIDKMNKTR